jgi:hypothetical protein
MTEETAAEKKKPGKPGRPRGLGRVPGSGRRRGTPNRSTSQTREYIQQQYNPVDFLLRVARGLRWDPLPPAAKQDKLAAYPTADQRMHAAGLLLRRVMPELKATDLSLSSGDGGLIINVISYANAGDADR